MKKSAIYIVLILLFSCKSDSVIKEDVYEKEIAKCIYFKYQNIGCDLKKELKEFENYLIEIKVIEDSTGNSYRGFYQYILENDSIPNFPGNYDVNPLVLDNISIFQSCFSKYDFDKSEKYKASRFKKFRNSTTNMSRVDIDQSSHIAQEMLKSLDSNAFDIEIYKIAFLLSFYNIESNMVEKRIRDALPSVMLVIHSNKDIFINGRGVALSEFTDVINDVISEFTYEEQEIFIIKLKVDPDTKMGLISEIKELLRKSKALRIDYSTIQKKPPFK